MLHQFNYSTPRIWSLINTLMFSVFVTHLLAFYLILELSYVIYKDVFIIMWQFEFLSWNMLLLLLSHWLCWCSPTVKCSTCCSLMLYEQKGWYDTDKRWKENKDVACVLHEQLEQQRPLVSERHTTHTHTSTSLQPTDGSAEPTPAGWNCDEVFVLFWCIPFLSLCWC